MGYQTCAFLQETLHQTRQALPGAPWNLPLNSLIKWEVSWHNEKELKKSIPSSNPSLTTCNYNPSQVSNFLWVWLFHLKIGKIYTLLGKLNEILGVNHLTCVCMLPSVNKSLDLRSEMGWTPSSILRCSLILPTSKPLNGPRLRLWGLDWLTWSVKFSCCVKGRRKC